MAGDILRLLDQQEIETVRLVGHSMGGKVAMAVALQAGHRVSSLSVLDIAPVSYPHEFDTIINTMQGIPLQDYQKRQDVVEVLAKALADKNMGAFLAQNLGERAGSLYWRSNLLSLAKNMPLITGWPVDFDSLTYKGRTLFLRGSKSDYVTVNHEGKIAALFPSASIETIPGAGHWIHADAPNRTLSSLRSSLS